MEEIPSKLENKPHVGQTVVRFLCDKTYSLVSTSKLVPIGQDEVDKKRAKGDAKGYAEMETILKTKSTKPQDISDDGKDEIGIRDEKESSKHYSAITPLVGKLSPGSDYDTDELEAVLNAMILNDQKHTFIEEYKALQLGENVQKSSNIATLSPFLDQDGLIKMKSRLEYCDLLPEQSKYPVILDHPSKSKLSELLINDCHLSGHHSGPNYTRRTLRNRY